MSILVKIAKYIGFVVIAIMLLAIPALLTLAIVFDWGGFFVLLLGVFSVVEIMALINIFDSLSEE